MYLALPQIGGDRLPVKGNRELLLITSTMYMAVPVRQAETHDLAGRINAQTQAIISEHCANQSGGECPWLICTATSKCLYYLVSLLVTDTDVLCFC